MSKGKWHSTKDNVATARNLVIDDPSLTRRSQVVKALVAKQGISYAVANRAVNLASCRWQELFAKFKKNGNFL